MADLESAPSPPTPSRVRRGARDRRTEAAAAPRDPFEPAHPQPDRRRARREPAEEPAVSAGASRSTRLTNLITPAQERGRATAPPPGRDSPDVGQPGGPIHRPGDVPPSLTRRYFTEALRGGAAVAFYEGPGAKRAAFHDHGTRLATDQSHPAVVRDLAAIAAHRNWRVIQVKGADEFRREMWLEARALGLEVKGYKPRERDQQELDRRFEARARTPEPSSRGATEPGPAERPSTPAAGRERPDFEAGVAGTLVALGDAPYRRRTGEPKTPFIRIDRGGGRMLDVWGAGLPEALRRSGAQIGDAVRVRRDGVDVVRRIVHVRDTKTGLTAPQQRDVPRNRWVVEAERFRQASPSDAARDAQLRGAQSHLAVLNTVIDGSVRDPDGRARLRAEAREIVADELARGRTFAPARIREIEPIIAQDLAEARRREAPPERAHRR